MLVSLSDNHYSLTNGTVRRPRSAEFSSWAFLPRRKLSGRGRLEWDESRYQAGLETGQASAESGRVRTRRNCSWKGPER